MKKGYRLVLKLVVSSLLLAFLINKYEVSTIYATFKNVKGNWVVVAIGCMLFSNILGTLQWNLILKQLDIHLPFRRATAFYFTGLFFNNFLLSFIGGDVIRIYDIKKSSGKNSEAISTVLLDRLIGFITLSFIAFIGVLYIFDILDSRAVLYIIPGIFAVLAFVLLFLFHKPFARQFEPLGLKLTPSRMHKTLREIYNSIHYFRGHPLLLGKLFVIALFLQTARITAHYSLARSIDVSINIVYFFIFIPVITLLISIPVSFGGIGIREWSAAELFQIASVSGEDAVLFEGLAYIVAIICSLPGGLAFIFRKHELLKKN